MAADRAGRWPFKSPDGRDLGLRPRLVWDGPLALKSYGRAYADPESGTEAGTAWRALLNRPVEVGTGCRALMNHSVGTQTIHSLKALGFGRTKHGRCGRFE